MSPVPFETFQIGEKERFWYKGCAAAISLDVQYIDGGFCSAVCFDCNAFCD